MTRYTIGYARIASNLSMRPRDVPKGENVLKTRPLPIVLSITTFSSQYLRSGTPSDAQSDDRCERILYHPSARM
jgi:hypothetical protein